MPEEKEDMNEPREAEQTTGLTFSVALRRVKHGSAIQRSGWNGKGMYLYKAKCQLPFPPLDDGTVWKSDAFGESEFIVMRTADGKLIPWLASQSDILANDWAIMTE